MNKIKQLYSVILIAMMAFVLVACGDNQESNLNNTEFTSMTETEEDNVKSPNQSIEDEALEDVQSGETRYPQVNPENGEVSIVVKKADRILELWQGENLIQSFPIGLGWAPEGHKQVEGDGKTPEGEYYVCVKNSNSSFYLSLGVSYPNKEDATAALSDGRIDNATYERIARAIDNGQKPDWNTPLGGAIMIHGCGGSSDWTAGCVAVDNEVMDVLFDCCSVGTKITILP